MIDFDIDMKHHPALVFRKNLSEQFSDENGNVSRESVKETLEEGEFHDNFRASLKEDYLRKYQDLQSRMMSGELEDPENSEETRNMILDASTYANLFQMYQIYYNITMN